VTEGKQEKAGLGNYADPKGIAYYNKEMWEWWLPLAKASIAGLGGFDVDDSEIPILFRDKNGELHADYYMYVVVVQPK
ncbi:TPA: hypothetical protein HA265_01210, partial [Candidatus Woesearchaeota archaeon]|nr:hypothetical protein [Candidatus Woesearchaeota archaeon]